MKADGSPAVAAYCHCVECRTARQTPVFDQVAWAPVQLTITAGEDKVVAYDYTDKMTVYSCGECGSRLFNTNAAGLKSTWQGLFRGANDGQLPEEFKSQVHLFYGERVIDIDDDLPKFRDGPEAFGGSGVRLD